MTELVEESARLEQFLDPLPDRPADQDWDLDYYGTVLTTLAIVLRLERRDLLQQLARAAGDIGLRAKAEHTQRQ